MGSTNLTKIIIIFIVMFLVAVIFSFSVTALQYTRMDSSIVAEWNFDDYLNETINNYDGTNSGSLYGSSYAILNNGYYLDGTNDYITIDDNSDIDLAGTEYTISLWIKTDGTPQGRPINKDDGTATGDGYFMRFKPALQIGHKSGGVTDNWQTLYTPPTATWTHLAVVYDSAINTRTLYVNGVFEESDSTLNDMTGDVDDLYLGYLPSTQYYKGSIDELKFFNEALNVTEIAFLTNSGSPTTDQQYPFGPVAPGGNVTQYIEQTATVNQNGGAVTISSLTYQPVLSGSFVIGNRTNLTYTTTVNILPNKPVLEMKCRATIDSVDYGTERTATYSNYGSLYLTSNMSEYDAGNYTYTLECARNGNNPSYEFAVSNSVALIHILTNNDGNTIKALGSGYLDVSIPTGSDYTLLGTIPFNTSDRETDETSKRNIIVDGDLNILYNGNDDVVFIVEIDAQNTSINSSKYQRGGTTGSTGSLGGMITLTDISNGTVNVRLWGYTNGTTANNISTGRLNIKEFINQPNEINSTDLTGSIIIGDTWQKVANSTFTNNDHSNADVVVRSGISAIGNGQVEYKLVLGNDNSTEMIRYLGGSYGVGMLQYVFEGISSGSYEVELYAKENATEDNISIFGDLSLYVSNAVPFESNITSIRCYDAYEGNAIQSFQIVTDEGTTLSTTNGLIEFTPSNTTATFNTSSSTYFNNISTHNLNESINITLVRHTEIYAEELGGAVTINNFTITYNGTNYTTTTGTAYIPLYNETAEISISETPNYANDVRNLTASPYLQNYTFSLYFENSVRINIFSEQNLSLIDDRNVTISTISDVISFENQTDTGFIYLKFLTPNGYELRFSASEFDNISKFVTVSSDSTQNISVYLQQSNLTEIQLIEVVDTSSKALEGAIVRLQKQKVGEEELYYTVQESITNSEGITSVFVERDTTTYYRFSVVYNNVSQPIEPSGNLFTTPTNFIPSITETIQLVINLEQGQGNFLTEDSISYSLNVSAGVLNDTAVFIWNDANNEISGGKLLVYGRYLNNASSYELISTQTFADTSGSINYTYLITNNTIYKVKAYVYYPSKETFLIEMTRTFDIDVFVDKNTGLIYAILIIIVVALVTLEFGALISSILTFASMFLLNAFNLIAIPTSVITGLIALAFIIFIEVKRKQNG